MRKNELDAIPFLSGQEFDSLRFGWIGRAWIVRRWIWLCIDFVRIVEA